jgi:hypothetical protein
MDARQLTIKASLLALAIAACLATNANATIIDFSITGWDRASRS